jgi:hypothetical protein
MLRGMMRSEGPNPDDAFLKMIREFLNREGATVSTWDLKRVAEKYMPRSMDLRGDRKLDWFFDEWILGTGIPTYSLDYRVQPETRGFVIEGRLAQSGVSDTFIMPVPIYADDQQLGTVVVGDDGASFRFTVRNRPSRVSVDPQLTVLAQVKN